ncbi:hypothetical protein KI387_004808, partial [Taxus chinensis]
NESDDGDDGGDMIEPRPTGIAQRMPKWCTSTLRDARMDVPLDTSTPGPRTHSKEREEVNFALMSRVIESDEPSIVQEALHSKSWKDAMDYEYQSVMKNNTWQLVDLPPRKKPIGCRWIFKTKYKADGIVDKHKARLVAKGYTQKEGIDYEETFAPTAKIKTIRMIFALVAWFDLKVHQMDVTSVFLNGDLQEEVYMTQPEGYVILGREEKVCRLKKSLYGLKQAPRAWYIKIDEHLVQHGFVRNPYDPNLYLEKQGGEMVIVVVYVDDLVITGSLVKMIDETKKDLKRSFDMIDLGLMHYCLGLEVCQKENNIFVSQMKYTKTTLEKFRMMDYTPIATPMENRLQLSHSDRSPK